jgi:predicted MFS family arabinose efflux permease
MWQLGLFVSLHQSFSAYGGALALAGMVGAVGGLALGRRIDAGHGRRAVAVTYAVATVIVTLRGASLGWPVLAVAAHALGALLMPLLGPTLVFQTANMSKASPCNFRFAMVTEGGWDVGCCAACLIAAALLSLGAPLSGLILLALPAVAASAAILWRLYPAQDQTLARPTLV